MWSPEKDCFLMWSLEPWYFVKMIALLPQHWKTERKPTLRIWSKQAVNVSKLQHARPARNCHHTFTSQAICSGLLTSQFRAVGTWANICKLCSFQFQWQVVVETVLNSAIIIWNCSAPNVRPERHRWCKPTQTIREISGSNMSLTSAKPRETGLTCVAIWQNQHELKWTATCATKSLHLGVDPLTWSHAGMRQFFLSMDFPPQWFIWHKKNYIKCFHHQLSQSTFSLEATLKIWPRPNFVDKILLLHMNWDLVFCSSKYQDLFLHGLHTCDSMFFFIHCKGSGTVSAAWLNQSSIAEKCVQILNHLFPAVHPLTGKGIEGHQP